MLAPAANDVVAFAASDSAVAPSATPATPVPTSRASPFRPLTGEPLGSDGITSIMAGILLVIGGAVWVAWRRRNPG
jgi:LPXTG-motif cell wall-anchored protein